jgi:aminopeptidase N
MLRHVAAFEWRCQLRNPVLWVGVLLFLVTGFGATVSDHVQIGSLGSFHKNSPYALLQATGVMGLFVTFVTVAMVAGAVLRDDETGFAALLHATPLRKFDLLVGRFAGALAAALLVVAATPLGILLGSAMPGLDADRFGPTLPGDYLYAIFLFGLPTLLATAAAYFAVAAATRSLVWSYATAIALLAAYFVAVGLVDAEPSWHRAAAFLDPFGLISLSYVTRYWTTTELDTLLPAPGGVLLWNRLLWAAVGLAMFVVAYRRFRLEMRLDDPPPSDRADDAAAAAPASPARATRAHKAMRRHQAELAALGESDPGRVREVQAASAARSPAGVPDIPPLTRAAARAQLWALARIDLAFIFRSPAFWVLVAIGLINAAFTLWLSGEIYGSPSYPVTRLMVAALTGSYAILPRIIAAFYAGELVWRDRDRRLHEIVDATAAPDWVRLVPKLLAITLALVATAFIGMAAAMLSQALRGYMHFEIGRYLGWFVWPTVVDTVLVAVLAIFVQVLVPHKYVGWAVMLAWPILADWMQAEGFEHRLYRYDAPIMPPLSDMNGAGRFWIGELSTQAYWLAFAAILLVSCHALWRRGATDSLRARLAVARTRLHGRALGVLAAAVAAWAGLGGWIYWNTDVLNAYATQPELDRRAADMEKALLRFESVPQPRVAELALDVQLWPRQARVVTHGRYTLVNRGAQAVDTLHLQWDRRLRLDAVDLPGAAVQQDWPRFHYRVYRLATPLQPGERRVLGFTTTLQERGFPNDRPLTDVVADGTFLDDSMIAPAIGFTRDGLLKDRFTRRRYGLPPELPLPPRSDDRARAFNAFVRDSDWVDADITVTTDADQTPLAPGRTVSDTGLRADPDARRTVRFRSDAPILRAFSIQSARYDVRRATWHAPGGRAVDLAVYYAPGHEANVDRMLDRMRSALALYDERFGPYPFAQARIVEFPAYRDAAPSFADTIPFSEGVAFLQRWTDPSKIDVASYVTAHELAHQWWGQQLAPAQQEGASMLTESFAQYSAMLAMEKVYGPDQVRRFLRWELNRYLRGRGSEVQDERPLARVQDGQQYVFLDKGALAMFWASEALGEDAVDRALRRLLRAHAFKGPPYPNTADFLALLREEAGPGHDALIDDLFERITLLDLSASNAVARKRADGRWLVAFDVDAHKYAADGAGRQAEVPMDEKVEIGVFTAEPGSREFVAADKLLLQQQDIATGRQHVEVVVDRPPAWVGVDPYNKRIDRNAEDNLAKVTLAGS